MSNKDLKERPRYGDILVEERKRLEHTKAEFAKLLGISIQRMRVLEARSDRPPTLSLTTVTAVCSLAII